MYFMETFMNTSRVGHNCMFVEFDFFCNFDIFLVSLRFSSSKTNGIVYEQYCVHKCISGLMHKPCHHITISATVFIIHPCDPTVVICDLFDMAM